MTSENPARRHPARDTGCHPGDAGSVSPEIVAAIATALRDATANLAEHVEVQARKLAEARISAAELAAAARVADLESAASLERQRGDELVADLRRQIAVQRDQFDRMAWLTGAWD